MRRLLGHGGPISLIIIRHRITVRRGVRPVSISSGVTAAFGKRQLLSCHAQQQLSRPRNERRRQLPIADKTLRR